VPSVDSSKRDEPDKLNQELEDKTTQLNSRRDEPAQARHNLLVNVEGKYQVLLDVLQSFTSPDPKVRGNALAKLKQRPRTNAPPSASATGGAATILPACTRRVEMKTRRTPFVLERDFTRA
jgi:hypothetical protein